MSKISQQKTKTRDASDDLRTRPFVSFISFLPFHFPNLVYNRAVGFLYSSSVFLHIFSTFQSRYKHNKRRRMTIMMMVMMIIMMMMMMMIMMM